MRESDRGPVIAVVGSGAVGSYYGGRLAQHGHEVHFLLRSDYEVVRERGWVFHSCAGDFSLAPEAVRVYNDARSMPTVDLVVVALKATSNDQFKPLIRPLLKPSTLILTLQNGLGNEERLAELFGAERILGGLAFVCLNRGEPGVVHHLDYGLVRVGDFTEGRMDRARRIVTMMAESGIECDVLPSLKYGRWEKLVWNVPFSGLGAALDLATDRLVASEDGLAMVRDLLRELLTAARAAGANLPDSVAEANIQRTLTMGSYRSSMQIDRQCGRPMEVEAILGEPVRAAQRLGVNVPLMGALYRMLRIVNLANFRKD